MMSYWEKSVRLIQELKESSYLGKTAPHDTLIQALQQLTPGTEVTFQRIIIRKKYVNSFNFGYNWSVDGIQCKTIAEVIKHIEISLKVGLPLKGNNHNEHGQSHFQR